MKGRNEEITLDDVLDFYLASSEQPGEDTLEEWIARFPQYENELREFAAYLKIDAGIPDPEYTEEEEETLAARAVSIVQNFLYEQRHKNDPDEDCASAEGEEEAITGILDEIDRQHSTIEAVAEKTGLSEGIIWMLDRRQVRYETNRLKAIEGIAFVLGKLTLTIKRYLRRPMRATSSHYKAEQAPEAQEMYDFSELVQIDEDLSEEQKEYWLSQPPIGSEEDS